MSRSFRLIPPLHIFFADPELAIADVRSQVLKLHCSDADVEHMCLLFFEFFFYLSFTVSSPIFFFSSVVSVTKGYVDVGRRPLIGCYNEVYHSS
jgi:hypothetical protein